MGQVNPHFAVYRRVSPLFSGYSRFQLLYLYLPIDQSASMVTEIQDRRVMGGF